METNENYSGRCNGHHNSWRWVGFGILGVLGFFAFAFIGGALIMWLWNSIVTPMFHISTISFWEAIGLAVLARLLFGGFRGGWHHGGRRWRHGMGRGYYRGHWNSHGNSCCNTATDEKCECGPEQNKWKYYDEYWKQEGEKGFDDFVKRKSESSDKS
jgi:hypothetical protein